MVLDRNADNLLRRDRAGGVPSRTRAARHRFHQRSAAAGPAVLLHRHAAAAARRAELPRAGDQPPALPDAQLPARRHQAPGRADRARRLRAEQPRSRRPARESGSAAIAPSRRRTPRTNRATSCAQRSESFADHYSQARLFFRSMAEPEQRHIISAFAFELGKVETVAIRKRMLGHLMIIDEALGAGVEAALGHGRRGRHDHAGARADRHGPVADPEPDQEGEADAQGPQGRRAGDRRRRRRRARCVAQGGREGRRAARDRRAEDRRRHDGEAARRCRPIRRSPARPRSCSTRSRCCRPRTARRCSPRRRPRSTGCATRSVTSR